MIKQTKRKLEIYLDYHHLLKNYLILNYQKYSLTKYQILSNILPFFDSAGISRKQTAFRNYAGTYEVEVMDSKSLDDSFFLAKRSINDFFRDLLEEKRGFKVVLSTRVTLKKWNNATNTYDIDTIYRNSDPIKVINRSLIEPQHMKH